MSLAHVSLLLSLFLPRSKRKKDIQINVPSCDASWGSRVGYTRQGAMEGAGGVSVSREEVIKGVSPPAPSIERIGGEE
jgi:hypothetical protein